MISITTCLEIQEQFFYFWFQLPNLHPSNLAWNKLEAMVEQKVKAANKRGPDTHMAQAMRTSRNSQGLI